MTDFNPGDRVTVDGTMTDDNFNDVPAPHSGRTGTIIASTTIRQPEGYDEDAWTVEFADGERYAYFDDWLRPALGEMPADTLDPGATRFLALVQVAKPGIDRLQSQLNGHWFAVDRLLASCSTDNYDHWYSQYAGRALAVTIGPDGQPRGVKMPHLDDVAALVASDPNIVIVATWPVKP